MGRKISEQDFGVGGGGGYTLQCRDYPGAVRPDGGLAGASFSPLCTKQCADENLMSGEPLTDGEVGTSSSAGHRTVSNPEFRIEYRMGIKVRYFIFIFMATTLLSFFIFFM